MLKKSFEWAGVLARDAIGSAGIAAVVYGAWSIYAPAGFITGGLIAIAGVCLVARQRA